MPPFIRAPGPSIFQTIESISTIFYPTNFNMFFDCWAKAKAKVYTVPPFIRAPVARSRHRAPVGIGLLGTDGNNESVLAVSGQAPPTPCMAFEGSADDEESNTHGIHGRGAAVERVCIV